MLCEEGVQQKYELIAMASWRNVYMHTQSALWIQRGERTKLYIDIRSIQPCILLTNMYERTIQYLPLHLIVGITMYIFYYGQFTLSVHTNLTVTDYFGSTIKTNEGHIIAWHTKDYYPTHMHRDTISYNLTQTSIKNVLFFFRKNGYMHPSALKWS